VFTARYELNREHNSGYIQSCGRAVAQAVSRQPVTTEAPVQSQISLSRMCGGQSVTATGFSPNTSGFPLSV
jgi:hypothetical protein